MHIIKARNPHGALPLGLQYLSSVGQPINSRVGVAITAPLPVTSIYERPTERVIFWPERDANPFFHIMEGLWMLAGRNDLAFVKKFAARMAEYSDDGETLQGAYGYRWRQHFGFDQIKNIIELLARDPFSRRAVLQMWDPNTDLNRDSKDLPCNCEVLFRVGYGKANEPNQLLTTVFNRSNDILFGLYGANAVHMSMLAEYVAANLGLLVGPMTTVSNNYHAYTDVFTKVYRGALRETPDGCPYARGEVAPYPLIENPVTWDRDLALFFEDPHSYGQENSFFPRVAKPLYWVHAAAKKKHYVNALEILDQCRATDWKRAAQEWVIRRRDRRAEKVD